MEERKESEDSSEISLNRHKRKPELVCVCVCVNVLLPSMGLGRKCAAGLVFLTLLPFMACPSLLRPRNQARPDSFCL